MSLRNLVHQQPSRLQTRVLMRCTLNVGSDKTGRKAWSLVADIGGTNARFAVVDLVNGQLQETTYFSVAEHHVFADVIDLFAQTASSGQWAERPQDVCLHRQPCWAAPTRNNNACDSLTARGRSTPPIYPTSRETSFLSLTILPPLGTRLRH